MTLQRIYYFFMFKKLCNVLLNFFLQLGGLIKQTFSLSQSTETE